MYDRAKVSGDEKLVVESFQPAPIKNPTTLVTDADTRDSRILTTKYKNDLITDPGDDFSNCPESYKILNLCVFKN